jgi:2-(1,2-epoxy-1,2-dihydrophenyl)acetyl-CoA isomerase
MGVRRGGVTDVADHEMVESGTPFVEAWVDDGVGVLRLNRPERRNALHPDMYPALRLVLATFARDDRIGCILLTGAGPGFCAGGDVRDGRPPDRAGMSLAQRAQQLAGDADVVVDLHELAKPSIAAINGPAVGAGLALALACDLRIAARSARLVTGWITLGFSGDFGGTWSLTRLVGPAKAFELLVDGAPVSGDEARTIGLVNRVVDDADLWPAAMSWASALAAGPRAAHGLMKQNVSDALHLPLREAITREAERMVQSSTTEDHRRAVAAWLNRRR